MASAPPQAETARTAVASIGDAFPPAFPGLQALLPTEAAVFGVLGLAFCLQLLFVDGASGPGRSFGLNNPVFGLWLLSAAGAASVVRRALARPRFVWSARLLGLVTLFLFLSTFRWHGSDDLPTSLLPFCLWHGSLTLDRFAPWFAGYQHNAVVASNGRLISFYPIPPALLSLPLYLLPALRGVTPDDHVLHQLEKCSASLISALAVMTLFKVFEKRAPRREAFALALVYALGTSTFDLCSQALWQHGTSCLALAGCLWAMDAAEADGRFWYGLGFLSAAAVASRSTNVLFAAGFLVAALASGGSRAAWKMLAGAAVPGALALAYWVWGTGMPLPPDLAFNIDGMAFPPSAQAVAGLLVSPKRGLLLFSPVALFAASGAWRVLTSAGNPRRQQTAFILLSAVAANFLLFSCSKVWGGGFSSGPRYLIEGLTVLFYFLPDAAPLAAAGSVKRAAWAAAVAVSIACHAVGGFARWSWEDDPACGIWSPVSYPPVHLISGYIRQK